MSDSMLDLIWRIFLLILQDEKVLLQGKSLSTHCMKSVFIRSFSGPYFSVFGLNMERHSYLSVFSPNTGKYGPEKLQIRTIFTLWQSHNIYIVLDSMALCANSKGRFQIFFVQVLQSESVKRSNGEKITQTRNATLSVWRSYITYVKSRFYIKKIENF